MTIRHPLRDLHVSLGARMGVFAGWEAPISYTSVIEEHLTVRREAGLFDLTHMGRIRVKGKGATELLDRLVPKKIAKAEPGSMPGPTAFLNGDAGFIDDIMPYRLGEDDWLLAVNAVNTDRDRRWIQVWKERLGYHDVTVSDVTLEYALIALQGPKSVEIAEKIGAGLLADLKPLTFYTDIEIAGQRVFLVSRSGWTGEDGFEFILTIPEAVELYKKLVDAGAKPAGLGARDSLRMEVGFVLAGEDIDEKTTPVDARYWLVFDYNKKDCVGCNALREALKQGASKVRYGVKLSKGERRIPRRGYKVYVRGTDVEIGTVTSGSYSPILQRGIGQAYIEPRHALPGLKVEVEMRGRRVKGKLVDFPFI